MTRYFRWLALLSLLALVACARHYLRADVASYEGVTVQPMQVWTGGNKLWVRVLITNEGPQPIMVNRDAMVARLASGQIVGRAVGTTSLHNVYVIPAGMSHAVYVEFPEVGFDWSTVSGTTIDFSGGVTRDGEPLPLRMKVHF